MEKLDGEMVNFACELLRSLRTEKNSIVSPISCAMCLGMVLAGAAGETRDQLLALFDGVEEDSFHDYMRQILASLPSNEENAKLRLATACYVRKNRSIRLAYTEAIKKIYQTQIQQVDFAKNSGDVIKSIRNFIKAETFGLIDFAPDSIDLETEMMLISTAYFKGSWQRGFPAEYTENSKFYVEPNFSVEVPMMNQKKIQAYAKNATCQVLGLEFKGFTETYLYFFLPKKDANFADFVNRLSGPKVMDWIKSTHLSLVHVEIPKFKIKFSACLNEFLTKTGCVNMYDKAKSDFDKVSPQQHLSVSSIFHEAVMKVDETGVEAAAVTITQFRAVSGRKRRCSIFIANHPFAVGLFHDKKCLFLGLVKRPDMET